MVSVSCTEIQQLQLICVYCVYNLSIYLSSYLSSYLPSYLTTYPPTHPPTHLPTYLSIYIPIYFSIFFRGLKFHLISCHKLKNNHCFTKCYQSFSDRVKAYFFNTIYNLSTQSIQISTLFYTNEIFDNTKRFTLTQSQMKLVVKRVPKKNNINCRRPIHIFNVQLHDSFGLSNLNKYVYGKQMLEH